MNCRFCGKELEPLPITHNGRTFNIGHKECDCKQSIEAKFEVGRMAEELRREERDRLIKKVVELSGVPKRYMNAQLEDESLYETALESGLYLFGGVGTGKTQTACSIAIRAAQNGKTIGFIKAYDISSMKLDDIKNQDVLIIDDLGADNVSEWSNSRMRAVIDYRYDSMKPIIITSNYSKSELAKKLHKDGDYTSLAIASRLTQMTVSKEMNGKDRRK